MLACALSFDEVIVTTFTAGQQETLPIWIFQQLTKRREHPFGGTEAGIRPSVIRRSTVEVAVGSAPLRPGRGGSPGTGRNWWSKIILGPLDKRVKIRSYGQIGEIGGPDPDDDSSRRH
jgi:hypothetical protein